VYGPSVRDPLLDDLDPLQRVAVTSSARPLAIIAPAGSGKTRVLTRRIAYGVREEQLVARHVLAVTFTRKAAAELVARIDHPGGARITAGTFHAIALAQLRRHASERNREPPRLLEGKARVLAPLLGGRGAAPSVAVADVASEIEWAKARLIAPDGYEAAAESAGRRPPRGIGAVAQVYARYEDEKRRRHLIDFDDVLSRCADAMVRDEAFAAGQRWRFRHIFVDEFQDATPLQLRLLRAWLGDTNELTVVGDPAQAIYGFTGADASPLLQFARAFPGGSTVALGSNYRSIPGVVALAEIALGGAAGVRRHPEAIRPDGEAPTITAFETDHDEARAVAEHAWKAHASGVPWRRMAVLFRTNAQSPRFEAAFARRGVPFRVGDDQRFSARPAVRALLDDLRSEERKAPGRPFAHLLADLAAGTDAMPAAAAGEQTPRAGPAAQPPAWIGDDITEDTTDDTTDGARSRLEQLLELGREYLAAVAGTGSVAEFTTWLDTAAGGAASGGDGVELVTFHRAKGLEWSVVFVTGLEAGLVPMSFATSQEARNEERRLLHVALSRAEDELHCSWSRTRSMGGRRARREPSPWLALLEDAANRAPNGILQGRRAPREHLAELRATLGAATPAGPPPSRVGRLRR